MIAALAAATVLALCDPTLKTCTKFEPKDALVVHRSSLCDVMQDVWNDAAQSLAVKLSAADATGDERWAVVELFVNDKDMPERSARCYAWARGERDTP